MHTEHKASIRREELTCQRRHSAHTLFRDGDSLLTKHTAQEKRSMNDVRTDLMTEASRSERTGRVVFVACTREKISHRRMELERAPRDYLH